MDRQATLLSLITFDRDLADLGPRLAALDWDADPAVVLSRQHIINVLQRFSSGDLDTAAVETWGNLIESREDISFEPGHETAILAAIHDLANPVLRGELNVDALIAALGGA